MTTENEVLRSQFEGMIVTALGTSRVTHTEDDLDRLIERMRPAFSELTDGDIVRTKRSITERLRIDMDLGLAVTGESFEPWLERRFGEIEWRHWLTYKQWLITQNWSLKVLDAMDELTDKMLDYAGDPSAPGPWARRGLAIGEVQSGKTATYLALINKAIDAGYRLVIVLAGGTEILRQQTQRRIDEGVIGREKAMLKSNSKAGIAETRYIGVGSLNATVATAAGMTTVAQDFRRNSYEATNIQISPDSPSPYIYVLKKNTTVLRTLGRWLDDQQKAQGKIPIPVLLLDDESDYASVNTKKEEDPTAINDGIRGLLQRFSRSSYLAVTATPFANIFIDHSNEDDLFPRDYVYALEAPTNYVGSIRTFGSIDDARTEHVVSIDDANAWLPTSHKSWASVDGLPKSLKEAIDTFFLANAIRDLRHDEGPRAMLINVSRYKSVQRQVFTLVEERSRALRNALDLHTGAYARGVPNGTIHRLEGVYARRYADSGAPWDEVLGALRNAAARIQVQLYNSDRDADLSSEDSVWSAPPRLIAVGGDVLSRGLTLGGLTVSYFHRRVGAYDTLMQMARWFGYRDEYADLCRVWIDPGMADQFRFVQDAIDELKHDLEMMDQYKLTPKDFGLAVRKHPGSLLVTAPNKMKAAANSEKTISLAGRRIETTRLAADDRTVDGNLAAFRRLISALSERPRSEHQREWTYWQAVPKELVADFLEGFAAAQSEAVFDRGAIARFVRGASANWLQSWDVVVVNGARTKGHERPLPGSAAHVYYPPERGIDLTDETYRISGTKSRLAAPGDVESLLSKEQRDRVKAEFSDRKRRMRGSALPKRSSPSEVDYYKYLNRPVLMLYPLQPSVPEEAEDSAAQIRRRLHGRPLVAVKIAVPSRQTPNDRSADVKYVINKVAQQRWFPEFVDEEDEDDPDLD